MSNKPGISDPAHAWPDHILAASKGYEDVRVTPNGGPTFRVSPYLYPVKGLEKNIVRIKLTGIRRADFARANEAAGIKAAAGTEAPDNYTWHHVDDYDPSTGMFTMELVKRDAHIATYPHDGAAKYYVIHHDVKYKR